MEELADLLGESAAIKAVREKLRQLLERQPAGRRLPAILIQGETGTGKGLVARLMHRMGPRKGGPFVDINCPAIPETLLEAELFGYERGAFTDARHAKPGLFHTAHRGTLFLDEVGLLPESVQAKLLTVLEDRAVRRLGGTQPEAVDVCVISATNANLQEAVRARRFRDDLYHRLAVITLDLPPLRERGRDVLLLAERFLARACLDYELSPKRLNDEAQARLLTHHWPGNIRELANVMERAALFADVPVVTGAMLEPLSKGIHPVAPASGSSAIITPEEAMRQRLLRILEESAGNISEAATRLGIARNTLYARLEKHGVRAQRAQPGPRRHAGRPAAVAVPAPTGTRIQWEYRGITLLRADLVAPAGVEAWSGTSRVLEDVIDKLRAFGGRVEELTPTGVLASFGVDLVDDPSWRAAHAAMAVHKGAARARQGTSRMPGVKIGIHVAQLLVGRSAGRIDIDANAKRTQWPVLDQLLQTIEPNETVASAVATPFLERRFELVPIGGGAEGVDPAYRLTGQERRGLGLWGAMTQFVGRHDELEVLRGRLAAAEHGQGQFVAVVGEPGVGKSRLLWEFTHSAHVSGWLVLEAGAVPYGKTTPYLPAVELLKVYCGIAERDDQRAIREKLTGKLLALDRGFEVALPAFLTLLDLPVDDREWHALDPAGRRRRTLDALKRLLLPESQVRPLVLVFEDLQWVDGETQALLESLVESLPGARLLLLVSHRSEYAHDWGHQSVYTQLRIDPLSRESAAVLLEVLLGSDPSLDPLKRLLMERAEGNPLFVEESVRASVETGALTGARGAYQLARDLPAMQVPGTVQAILTARIDRLPPGEKRLLETAAVIGKDFAFALLETVADENEETLRRGLGHLQTAEFLYETRSFPDLEYTFKHALTHEVVYRGLLHEQRRALHARIASAIAAFDPDRLSQHGDRLAHHAFLGGLWPQAVAYLGQAGERALAVAAYMPAVSLFDRALAALQHLPEGPETRRQAVSLHLNIRHALQLLGELERCGKHLEEAERLAEAGGDQRELARVHSLVAQHFRLTGDLARAVASGEHASDIAERLGDSALRVQANGILASVYYSRGDYRKAAEVLRACAGPLGTLPHPDRSLDGLIPIFWHFYVVACLAQLGDFSEASGYADAGLRIAETADYGYGIMFACWGRGSLALLQGDAPQAVVLLERALALARTLKVRGAVPPLVSSLGAAYSLSGRSSDAVSLLEEGVRESASMKRGEGHSLLLVRLAEAYLLVGRIEDATSAARQALRLAHEKEERGHEAYAMYMLGESALCDAPANMAAAETSYRRGMALAEELLMRPLIAHFHLGLGKLYRQTDQRQLAGEHLAIATTMYREMDMRFWLEQAEDGMKESAREL